jgi:pimeloyl-ACP methyl ester carboxylesterase
MTDASTAQQSGSSSELGWTWSSHKIRLGMDQVGEGPSVLFLPALSSVSTRTEMKPLIGLLSSRFRTISIDWPGFGTGPRPAVSWTPDAMVSFLDYAVETLGGCFHSIVAAGHSATYTLNHVSKHPGSVDKLVLLAPTWRGPLPTMAGGQRPLFAKIKRSVESRFVGPILYRLNVNPLMVRMMVAGHVYSNKNWLSGTRLEEKRDVTEGANARFGSAAFVTGGLDLVASRSEFLALAEKVVAPILLVYGAETPSRSRAEMEALSKVRGVQTVRLEKGKLSIYEEFPDQVANEVRRFLDV